MKFHVNKVSIKICVLKQVIKSNTVFPITVQSFPRNSIATNENSFQNFRQLLCNQNPAIKPTSNPSTCNFTINCCLFFINSPEK